MTDDEIILKYNKKVSESKIFLRRCGYTILSNEDLDLANNKISLCLTLMMIFSFIVGFAVCKIVGNL